MQVSKPTVGLVNICMAKSPLSMVSFPMVASIYWLAAMPSSMPM